MRPRIILWTLASAICALALSGVAGAHHQHGGTGGHLTTPAADTDGDGDWGKIEFISKLVVPDAEEGLIADVGVDPEGDYAYLARWGGAACAGPENVTDGGVYVVDIRDLENPTLVTFIKTHQDTLVGEGVQIIDITTPEFTGEVLLMNHEGCGKNFKAGVSLWDVTDPSKPKKLSEHFGDITIGGARDTPDVNQTHSAFMWDTGDNAYLISVDDEEGADVDIFDITDPKHPELIAELDLNDFGVFQPELRLTDSFLHDLVVKEINGRWTGLLSYWDGGWVLLDLEDPANPQFISDTDYPSVDPELLEQAGVSLTPEGNAHQAEFTIDNRFVIGTDEDFDPFRVVIETAEGDSFLAKMGTQTDPEDVEGLTGTPIFVGRACPGDPAVPEAEEGQIAVVERGLCTFEEKAQAVIDAGYDAMIIFNREGNDACTGVLSPFLEAEIPTLFIGRDAGFDLLDQDGFDLAACLAGDGSEQSGIPLERIGDEITEVDSIFDGWGYVHLFSVNPTATTLTEVDTFAIPEAMDPDFAEGFGDLSVHEVAVDPQDPTLAYLSYYDAGLRAVQIQCTNPAVPSTCELVEVGGFIDRPGSDNLAGNDFWGVETFVDEETGDTIILASDRDTGLWIFRDP